jgi:hypothetical protein
MRSSLMLFLLSSHCVFAQWSNDPNVNTPISTASGDQRNPTIVKSSSSSIITWADFRNNIWADVYAQRINNSGFIQWQPNGLPIVTTLGNQYAAILSDNTGGAIFVWTSCAIGDTACDIFAQRIDASGIAQWDTNGVIVCNAPGNQGVAGIVTDGEGGVICLWLDSRRGIIFTDLYVQRISASGVVLWTTNGVVIATTPARPSFSGIASDGTGGAIITWQDFRSAANDDIYAQRISASGSTLWSTNGIPVCTHPANQRQPKIVPDGANGAIITWGDDRNSPGVDRIYAQRIVASGLLQWTSTGVPIHPTSTSTYSSMIGDAVGGAIIAWSGNGVFAQRISSNGILLWDSNAVALSTEPINYNTAIVSDGAGGAIVAWLDTRNDSTHNITDIYAQRVNASGTTMWQTNGVPITTAPGSQFNPAIATDGAGGAIITWTDRRSATNADIYAQQVSANGILGQVTSVNEREIQPRSFALLQNYPNPFNPSTTIEFELPRSTIAKLVVVNILGQEVATLVNRQFVPGKYRETFNAKNLTSGMYFYKLQTSQVSIVKKMLLLR